MNECMDMTALQWDTRFIAFVHLGLRRVDLSALECDIHKVFMVKYNKKIR